MNYGLVLKILGIITVFFSLTMLAMVPVALAFREFLELRQIVESMTIGLILGALMYLPTRRAGGSLYRRESLAIVALCWILAAAIGALPFILGGMTASYTDAFFESMSGLTTCGASILSSIEGQARTLLFWRSFLHFVGGLGIVVFFITILPALGVGGKALFKQEVAGPVPEAFTPRIKDTAVILCLIYLGLVVVEAIVLMIFGMSFFDAINHAMATIATGGFSTKNDSVASFAPGIQWVVILFMIVAGTNFTLHLRFLKGDFLCYFKDSEFRVYIGLLLLVSGIIAGALYLSGTREVSNPGGWNVRDAVFATTTINTCTGYATSDFNQWPSICRGLLFLMLFVGGMAGSTAGGIKTMRWLLLFKSAGNLLAREVAPRRVHVLKIDGKPVDPKIVQDVFVFFFLYLAVFAAASVLLMMMNLELSLMSCFSAVATCMGGVGPGLDAVGPASNYFALSHFSKWVLSLCMILGRLELYAILIVMNPRFWTGK